jgi:hypothetical protein
MGTLNLERACKLIDSPGSRSDCECYVETGVSEGTSMAAAAAWKYPAFKELLGVECDGGMVGACRQRFAGDARVEILHASSLDVLPGILSPHRRTLFWLDAHYDGGRQTSFHVPHGQCPLLGELRAIMSVPWRVPPVILIDDASVFCSREWWARGAHGHGMDPNQWPDLQSICDTLGVLDQKYSVHVGSDNVLYCWHEDL